MKSLGSFFLLILCVWLGGCQSDEDLRTSDNTGFLVTLTDELEQAYTRATPAELGKPIKEQFKLLVVDTATGKETYSGQCSESVLVKAGLYNLTATFGDNPVIALDAPYYEGKLEGQEVKTGEMTSVEIPCSVANALLSVSFNHESLKKAFENYYVTVLVNDQAVEIDSTGGKSAYFRANSSVKLVFHGYLSGTGQEMTYDIPEEDKFQNVVARTHVKVTLGLNSEDLSSGVGISVEKLDTETATISETIPVSCLPAPKISAVGFDLETHTMDMYETESPVASIDFELSSSLQELEFSMNFEDENMKSLNGDYALSVMGEDVRNKFTEAGFVLPSVGETESSLVIPTASLLSSLDENVVSNSITIKRVVANDRENKEGEITYTIHTHQPVMAFSVPDGNVWTKEFTAVMKVEQGKGNREKIGENLLFEYSDDNGISWKELNNVETQRFTECPELKAYKVRATYRGKLKFDPVDIQLETPQQLPNSGMEEWHAESLGTFVGIPNFWNKYEFYDFLPYNTGEMDIWWTTNNERSRDYSVSRVHVTSSPCVSYSESVKHGGNRAALIYTSGHGGGYASTSNILYEEGAFAGCLFVGTYSWSSGTENMNLGHTFEARPTSVRFWYNYIPKNSDSFKVYVELKNGEEIIGTGTFIPSALSAESGWQEGIVEVEYVDSPKSATSICVQFLSTDKTSFSESDFDKNKSITFPVMGSWNAHIGSMLYIDDISLVYDK